MTNERRWVSTHDPIETLIMINLSYGQNPKPSDDKCPRCEGRGWINPGVECRDCHGTGKKPKPEAKPTDTTEGKCKKCKGTGKIRIRVPEHDWDIRDCPDCNGSGKKVK